MNINPGWTGTFPFGTTAYYARGNAGATVRFAYTSNGADTFQAYDGTNIASVAAGHTIGTRKRYCTRWSAAGNFLRVENIAAGTSNSQAFTTFPAFDPSITTVDANALIDSIVFGRSPLACQ